MIFGDPHILPFDASSKEYSRVVSDPVRFLHSGDFWLVKSNLVHIQAHYFASNKWGWSSARAIAVGGPFLNGNTLIIDHENVTWNGQEIMPNVLGSFQNDLVGVRATLERGGIGRLKKRHPVHVFRVDLPMNITLMAARFTRGRRMDIVLKMRPIPGGQDGHCGNFNGILADDTAQGIKERFGVQVHGEELLFPRKEYQYVGCFMDDKSDRDLPVKKRKRNLDLVACSILCSGYKFFARQGRGKCFCGNSYGRHGPESGCRCDRKNIGRLKNCVYRYEDGEAEEPREPCPQARRAEAERLCSAALLTEPGLFEACVFDFCFGGEDALDFVEEDGFAAEMIADVDDDGQ